MDITSAFKFFVAVITSITESKYRGIFVGALMLALVWVGVIYAASAKSDPTVERRVTILETKIDGIANSLERIERSESETRKDLSELKNVLISK
jgi:hypothetical protein